jgi:hypothetical protein
VAALVVQHLPDGWFGQPGERPALEVPAAPVEREAVHEHHGQRRFAAVDRVDLLDRQLDAVLGDDRVLAVGVQPAERLGGRRVRAAPPRHPDGDRRAGGRDPDGGADDGTDLPGHRHR